MLATVVTLSLNSFSSQVLLTEDFSTFDQSKWSQYSGYPTVSQNQNKSTDNVNVNQSVSGKVYVDAARNFEPASRLSAAVPIGTEDFEITFDYKWAGGQGGAFDIGLTSEDMYAYIQDHSTYKSIIRWGSDCDALYLSWNFDLGWKSVKLVEANSTASQWEYVTQYGLTTGTECYFKIYRQGSTLGAELHKKQDDSLIGSTTLTSLSGTADYQYFIISSWDNICNSWHGDHHIDNLNILAESSSIPVQVKVQASPAEGGSGATYDCNAGDDISITANANTGWRFVKWSDGNGAQSRLISVSVNSPTYTAIFEKITTEVNYSYGSTDQSLALSWDAVPDAVSYEIYRASSEYRHAWELLNLAPQYAELVAEVTATSFEDVFESERDARWSYVYFVVPVFGDGEKGEYSNGVFAETKLLHDHIMHGVKDDVKEVFSFISDCRDIAEIVYSSVHGGTLLVIPTQIIDAGCNMVDQLPGDMFKDICAKPEPTYSIGLCPIDFELHNNNSSDVITKHNATNYGCVYIEDDLFNTGDTNDLLIVLNPKLESYTLKIIPDIGSEGDTFSAFMGGSGWSEAIYTNEVIATGANYETNLPIRPALSLEQTSNSWHVIWNPVNTNLTSNTTLQVSGDLSSWTNHKENIEFTQYYSKGSFSKTNILDRWFFRVTIKDDE